MNSIKTMFIWNIFLIQKQIKFTSKLCTIASLWNIRKTVWKSLCNMCIRHKLSEYCNSTSKKVPNCLNLLERWEYLPHRCFVEHPVYLGFSDTLVFVKSYRMDLGKSEICNNKIRNHLRWAIMFVLGLAVN